MCYVLAQTHNCKLPKECVYHQWIADCAGLDHEADLEFIQNFERVYENKLGTAVHHASFPGFTSCFPLRPIRKYLLIGIV